LLGGGAAAGGGWLPATGKCPPLGAASEAFGDFLGLLPVCCSMSAKFWLSWPVDSAPEELSAWVERTVLGGVETGNVTFIPIDGANHVPDFACLRAS
jgi:hypothetical protein